MKRMIPLLALLVFAVPLLAGDDWKSARKIDAYLDALVASGLAHGSVAFSENERLVYRRGFGAEEFRDGCANEAGVSTDYRIGTLTSVFTSVLTMQLAEGARITLDSKLAEFFPDLPNALEISYRDLLQHRSGLADFRVLPELHGGGPPAREQVLAALTKAGPRFAPRERVEWNASNPLVLSYVLEKIFEKPYREILQKEILWRIGMPSTYLPDESRSSTFVAHTYRLVANRWEPEPLPDPRFELGAGGLVSTPTDLARFLDLLATGKLTTAQSLETLRGEGGAIPVLQPRAAADQTGFGYASRDAAPLVALWYFPAKRLSLALTLNASALPLDQVTDELLSLALRKSHRPAPLPPPLTTAGGACGKPGVRPAG